MTITPATPGNQPAPAQSAVQPEVQAAVLAPSDLQNRIYQAISIQRPVVQAYLKQLRREKPQATPAQLLRTLENRYVATVTTASTGVGASAAIPGVGIPLALGLGVADLLFFYEASALYVLAASELHGLEVKDAERAKPLVLGMLLGQKSQSKVTRIVLDAAGAGGVTRARDVATGTAARVLPKAWGEVLTQQLPDSALAPVATVIARQALMQSGRLGTRTVGKAIPFGLGAVVGGVGSFTFGRDVVKATRAAFPTPPADFPEWLHDLAKPERAEGEPTRAVKALQDAAATAVDVGGTVWGGAFAAGRAIRSRFGRKKV